MFQNDLLRWAATLLAIGGGLVAVVGYMSWALRSSRHRNLGWFLYFMVLFMSEALFVLVYADGLLRYPEPTALPLGIVEFFLVFGIPISVGMSAFGWLVLLRSKPGVPS